MKTAALADYDLYLFHQGTNYHAYEMLGAHYVEQDGERGVRFAVWAPHARDVSVVGDFNDWDTRVHPMERLSDGETWATFIPGLPSGTIYKYAIDPPWGGPRIMKADPYGFYAEKKPLTASRTYDYPEFEWHDAEYQAAKKKGSSYEKPMLTYEVKAVAGSVTGITIDPKEYGYVPAVGDYLGLVNASAFGSNGSPVAITAVAPNATDASLLDITIALTGATVGAIVCLGFSSTKVPAPNAYLYNDIYMGDIEATAAGVAANTVAATGAAVDFHGEGILIDLTPCAGIAAAMKAAVPNVIQVVA